MPLPAVSIICNTFNHEKYIREALEGFISQKVSVPFEILIHDDASTDGTAAIIREYEMKYPDIVKPIYQTVNQYSQKVKITPQIQLPRVQGKYVAFCEGDDYWTDPGKLQLQYDFMEAHPEYSGCCHAYSMVKKDGTLIQERHDLSADGTIPIKKLLGNQLEVPHFATLFLRYMYIKELKARFLDKPCNDMVYRLVCAAKGPLYYFNRNMSCYRRFVDGSWTMRKSEVMSRNSMAQRRDIELLKRYDEYTEGKFHSDILWVLDAREFEAAILDMDYQKAYTKNAYNQASIKRKMGILMGLFFPSIIKFIQNILLRYRTGRSR